MKKEMKKKHNKKMRMTAVMLLFIFTCQLLYPNVAMALTTGPSQPEVQGFEPVGTTDMVDMFSGSFVYNIPLLDVEGYPVNISYHGGVTMEQEASWVGLGWNINPGVINRAVRGVPDDFNGDSVIKELNIKPEETWRIGRGVGVEFVGIGDPMLNVDLSFGSNINISNYRGVSCDFSYSGGINVFRCVTAGVNIGVGSQTGAAINLNAGLSLSSVATLGKESNLGLNGGIGGGYSTRTGLKDLSFSMGANRAVRNSHTSSSLSSSGIIPIGVTNYVPVITNSSTMKSIYGRVKLGWEFSSIFGYGNISLMGSKIKFNNDGSRAAYGYLYLQNAGLKNEDILDFTRDKDGMFNKSMQYLPVPNMTYDVYSVSGQGTGGMFRPFRNDFGSVYDPLTESNSLDLSFQVEGAIGNIFEGGLDASSVHTEITSGPWLNFNRVGTKGFQKNKNGSVYENVYFKQGGEMTSIDATYFALIGGKAPIAPELAMALPSIKPNSDSKRDARGNLIFYHTAAEASLTGVGADQLIISHRDIDHSHPWDVSYGDVISRIGTGSFQRKKDQISEIVQVQKDGRRYVYGIPAMNNMQREVTFAVDPAGSIENGLDLGSGLVAASSQDVSTANSKGLDHYYSSTVTPSYAHSYLLTSVLSNDYVDVNGDGVTDDDLGSFTKFQYTRTDSDYRWAAPYSKTLDTAQYNPGYWSDKKDDKANIVCGSREQWNLHKIETKNYIAEFYTSLRDDALGIDSPIHNSIELYKDPKLSPSVSYKLDSIKLYNKHDRFVNNTQAIPIKSVFFEYDYSLCQGLPNSTSGEGKLTLQRIYFRYGNSDRGMISPYQFKYSSTNPTYNLAEKDRWGNYKPNNHTFTNYEFPYVNQNDPMNDDYASAWSLEEIDLPSGGVIKAEYESNDYAFVQDKPVNEMFLVQGVGASPNFVKGFQLYTNRSSPNLYAYFMRRPGSELSSLSFAQNYMGRDFKTAGQNCMYFNFNVQLTNSNATFEQIKGYANVVEVGRCSNDAAYGYIKFEGVVPSGTGGVILTGYVDLVSDIANGGAGCYLSPVTFTALNTGRYNLPQVIFPGQNPDESNIKNILSGLKGAFDELLNFGRNPVARLVERGGGKTVNLTKSFIRLHSVGMSKKGGGQRVKALTFSDQWDVLAGGSEQGAFYGKQYLYVTQHEGYGQISSGVASYEPLIGGDENPMRQPVKYTVQSGSKFLLNCDPVDLYQETPIGESLYPTGQVGYSEILVTSSHLSEGRSSKTLDKYEFYTAKDFPAQFIATSIDPVSTNRFFFFSQTNSLTAKQGYTLIFNDMHGKPKKVEHDVVNPNTGIASPVSYEKYRYKQREGLLDNMVDCFVYNGTGMEVQNMQLGIEEDITLDSRQKSDFTVNSTLNGNVNVFLIPIPVIPFFIGPIVIPFAFGWGSTSENKFQSAVVAKVIQQYGILDNVESYREGAKTIMQNEIFDPVTGQAVVTSVNNEFEDKEYTTTIPAWWAYSGMAGSYSNIGYKDFGTITVNTNNTGTLNTINSTPLYQGDYLSIYYKDNAGARHHTTGWVMGTVPQYSGSGDVECSGVQVLPHFPTSTPGWSVGTVLDSVTIRVISSGHKNMLDQNVQSYTTLGSPLSGGTLLPSDLYRLIDISANTFSDSNTRIIPKYIANPDTVNPYAIGERGEWRLLSEYAYHADRKYVSTTSRTAGLFDATSLFINAGGSIDPCIHYPYNFLQPNTIDQHWKAMRTVTKWSPYGQEVENKDALGNFSTAIYGYNETLPIAVAANTRQGDVLSLGFEDYYLLQNPWDVLKFKYFPRVSNGTAPIAASVFGFEMNLAPDNIFGTEGHTGLQSYYAKNNDIYMRLPIRNESLGIGTNKYNNYFSSSPVSGYEFTPDNGYMDFSVRREKSYILNYWIKQDHTVPLNLLTYSFSAVPGVKVSDPGGAVVNYNAGSTTNIIDGWQQMEVEFSISSDAEEATIIFPENFYIDDLRVYPQNGNMKAFVYRPVNKTLQGSAEKLIATLDENNFATFYEYDQEGTLVRTKKETTKGIMTISESRRGTAKK